MDTLSWSTGRIAHAQQAERIYLAINWLLCWIAFPIVWALLIRQYWRTYNRLYILLWPGGPYHCLWMIWGCTNYLIYYGLTLNIQGHDIINIAPVMPSTCEAALQIPGRDESILPCFVERVQGMVRSGEWASPWLSTEVFDIVVFGVFGLIFLWAGYVLAARHHWWPTCTECRQKKPVTAFVPPSRGGDKTCHQCRDVEINGIVDTMGKRR